MSASVNRSLKRSRSSDACKKFWSEDRRRAISITNFCREVCVDNWRLSMTIMRLRCRSGRSGGWREMGEGLVISSNRGTALNWRWKKIYKGCGIFRCGTAHLLHCVSYYWPNQFWDDQWQSNRCRIRLVNYVIYHLAHGIRHAQIAGGTAKAARAQETDRASTSTARRHPRRPMSATAEAQETRRDPPRTRNTLSK